MRGRVPAAAGRFAGAQQQELAQFRGFDEQGLPEERTSAGEGVPPGGVAVGVPLRKAHPGVQIVLGSHALEQEAAQAEQRALARVKAMAPNIRKAAELAGEEQAEAEQAERERVRGTEPRRYKPSPEGAGMPLPEDLRRRVQEVTGRPVDPRVRIHTGEQAARAAEVLDAVAFAQGTHVFFGRNMFRPDTPEGFALLVHELTHVQQHLQGRDLAGEPQPGRRAATGRATRMLLGGLGGGPGEELEGVQARGRPGSHGTLARGRAEGAVVARFREEALAAAQGGTAGRTGVRQAAAAGRAPVARRRRAGQLPAPVLRRLRLPGLISRLQERREDLQGLRSDLQQIRQAEGGRPRLQQVTEQAPRIIERLQNLFGPRERDQQAQQQQQQREREAEQQESRALERLAPQRELLRAKEPERLEVPLTRAREGDLELPPSPENYLRRLMDYFHVHKRMREDEFLDEITERVMDLLEEELISERERGAAGVW
ncbi:MAG: hypothetical protein KatS3mg102_2087 [Planctomycetota bacterium]|nr:MAG: hypothetical protein KatS3mg102_2087 [Planctomycetota bacterium]